MLIVNEKHSTIETAKQFAIPLKTLEKWITVYNKDHNVFNPDYKSQAQIIEKLKKRKFFFKKNIDIKKTISLLAKKE